MFKLSTIELLSIISNCELFDVPMMHCNHCEIFEVPMMLCNHCQIFDVPMMHCNQ